MKFTLTFKTPDMTDQILDKYPESQDEDDALYEEKLLIKRLLDKYISYGEYINIEFDTKTMEAKVLS